MTTTERADAHAVSRALLAGTGVEHDHVLDLVRATLAEDLAWGPDVTTEATIPATAHGSAHITARAAGTVAGLGVAAAVPELLSANARDPLSPDDGHVVLQALVRDGDRVLPGDRLLRVSGPLRSLLTGERTMLNLLCQLSGVATETTRWVLALSRASGGDRTGPRVSVRDTRKTVPGLRVLQKYAVRCGGGVNHRMGLGDAALIKDNHVVAAGSITAAYQSVREHAPTIAVEVECDTLAQVAEALAAGADLILLDNMDTDELRAAVALARGYPARLEASGGLTLDGAAEVAATGVDYVAVGALTHSAPALDLGLDLDPGDAWPSPRPG
jgi:nicotinate-nucleotide pyrophosphorylase (carboxylating)